MSIANHPAWQEGPLSSISGDARARLADLAEDRWLSEGATLWAEGDRTNGLALLLEGALQVSVDGQHVATLGPGSLVGEGTAFFEGAVRMATLTAGTAARLLCLHVSAIDVLRADEGTAFDGLIDASLETLAARVKAATAALASQATADATPPIATPTLLSAWHPVGPVMDQLQSVLGDLPGLRGVSLQHLYTVAATFETREFKAGELIFAEGAEGAALYLVGDGQVDVLRSLEGARALRLATVGAGVLIGVGSCLKPGRRGAACVAAATTRLFRLRHSDHSRLRGATGRAWRQALLVTLHSQLCLADSLIVEEHAIRALT